MDMLAEELALVAPESIRKMKAVEFQKLGELGYFDDERVELLFGVVVEMTPIDPSHVDAVSRIAHLLIRSLDGRATVRPRCSFAALDDSMPVPVVAPGSRPEDDHVRAQQRRRVLDREPRRGLPRGSAGAAEGRLDRIQRLAAR